MITTFKKLRQILTRREQLQLVVLLAMILMMAFTQALGVASVMPFIALVMEPTQVYENEWLLRVYNLFEFQDEHSFIIGAGIAMLLIVVFSNMLSALTTWAKIKFAWQNNHRLSLRLMEKYLSMPYPFYLNKNSADLSKNVLLEVKHLTNSFLIPLLMMITKVTMVIFILAMLIWVDVIISLMAVLFLGGAYAAIFLSINKKLKHRGALRMQANKMRFKVASEAFGGIKELKVMHRELHFLKMYAKASKENVRHLSWNAVVGQIPAFAMEAIAFGAIILFILILLVTREDVQQVVPMVAVFVVAGYRLMPAFQQISNAFAQMQFNQAVLRKVHGDLTEGGNASLPIDFLVKELPEPLPFYREIRLSGVSYSYPNTAAPVIQNLELVIFHNTSVALVGATGAGKTTLADILLGLLFPEKGTLMVDGILVDQSNLCSWQLNLGYVPQQIYLKDDTVARNIAFGLADKEIDRDKLAQVAQVANIYVFIIQELPHGFDTMVGERGIRLSGGQRQRIGIARALYHNPEVLVFDEATSALDGVTEDSVLRAMENAARLKTLIIIAHRLTTVKNCDMIYLIDRGRIVDSGTYEHLLKNNSQFRSMAKVKS